MCQQVPQQEARNMAETSGTFLPGTFQMFVLGPGGELRDQEVKLIPPPSDSPNDPMNWSTLRKYWHAALVLFVTAMTAAISNDAGATSDGMLDELGISYDVANTAAGVLFLSIGYWCLLASPMPWLYGRRIQYLICLFFGLIGSIWLARVQGVQDSIWNQMFVGASESCAEALAQLSLSDLFFQHQRGTVLGLYILATSIGTFLGPLVAGYISIQSWRWVGWTGAIVCGGSIVVFYFGLEETAFHRDGLIIGREVVGEPTSPVANDAKISPGRVHDGKSPPESFNQFETRNSSQSVQFDVDRKKSYRQRIALITPAPNLVGFGFKQYIERLWHSLRVFAFPAVLYSGLQWGAQDAWLSFYLTVEEDNYYNPPWNYTNQAVAIMNIPTLIGATLGCIYGGWASDIFVKWMAKRRGGISEAEDRLWLMYLSAVVNPAGLILFGVGTAREWSWPAPYIGLAMTGFGFGCAGDLSMSYLMDAYPDMVLEGMVGVAVINNTLACVFTFLASRWIASSGVGATFVTIGVLSLVFHLATVPMQIYGKACRRRTFPRYRRFLYLRDGQ